METDARVGSVATCPEGNNNMLWMENLTMNGRGSWLTDCSSRYRLVCRGGETSTIVVCRQCTGSLEHIVARHLILSRVAKGRMQPWASNEQQRGLCQIQKWLWVTPMGWRPLLQMHCTPIGMLCIPFFVYIQIALSAKYNVFIPSVQFLLPSVVM